jgi:hypothetical protein
MVEHREAGERLAAVEVDPAPDRVCRTGIGNDVRVLAADL